MPRNRALSMALLLVFIVGLYVFQNKAVTPAIMKVIDSDLFVKQTDDFAEPMAIQSEIGKIALMQCNNYLKNNYPETESAAVSNDDYRTFGLGDYTYVVKSSVEILAAADGPGKKDFLCKIKFTGGDNLDFENWEVFGFKYGEG